MCNFTPYCAPSVSSWPFLCESLFLLLAFAIGVTDIAVDFSLFSSFVGHT